MSKLHSAIPPFYIVGDVTDETLKEFLSYFDSRRKQDMRIVLNSPGGDVPVGFQIYEMLSESGSFVATEAYGEVSSIAALIFCAGGTRLITPSTLMFLHDTFAEGGESDSKLTRHELGWRKEELDFYQQAYNTYVAKATGQSYTYIATLCNREVLLKPVQLINEGFAHGYTNNWPRKKTKC